MRAMQVVEAAARRALAAERAQQQLIQTARQQTPKSLPDDSSPSTSGKAALHAVITACYACPKDATHFQPGLFARNGLCISDPEKLMQELLQEEAL